MEGVKGGPRLSHFDPETGTEPYAKSEGQDLSSTLRKKTRKSHLRKSSYLGWPFEYDPAEVGTLAPRSFEATDPTLSTCPVCRGTFASRRSNHIYCSPRCRRKGSRLGRETIERRRESKSFSRLCRAPDCGRSLAGRTARAKYCSDACRVRAAYRTGGTDRLTSGVSQA